MTQVMAMAPAILGQAMAMAALIVALSGLTAGTAFITTWNSGHTKCGPAAKN